MKDEKYVSQTKNGSHVEITKRYFTEGNAWTRHTFYVYYYDIRNPKPEDSKIMEDYPRWFSDYTGKSICLNTKDTNYMQREILEKLQLKTPYIESNES